LKRFFDSTTKSLSKSKNKKLTHEKVPRAASDSSYRSKSRKKHYEKKPLLKLNAYANVDKILTIIHRSEELSDNQPVCNHFFNIKYNRKMDDVTRKMLKQNKVFNPDEVANGYESETKMKHSRESPNIKK
jgi:hypothetical protein